MEVDINKIKPNSYNPKTTDDYLDEYNAIKKGIEIHGMKTPLDVREVDNGGYEIIDGYHRWQACKELGWQTIPISNWGKLSNDQARKITILKEKAHIPLDLIKTSTILKDLVLNTPIEDLMFELGYVDLEQLKNDIQLANFDWSLYEPKEKEGFDEEARTFKVTLSKSQYEVVIRAITNAKSAGETESDARALELICADYLSGA